MFCVGWGHQSTVNEDKGLYEFEPEEELEELLHKRQEECQKKKLYGGIEKNYEESAEHASYR
jgi:hypothetical protein